MSDVILDEKGLVITCPKCLQKNRVAYDRLDHGARCGKCRSDLPRLSSPLDLNSDSNFNTLIHSSPLPVLADFWAAWCGPCKMLAPELRKIAAANEGELVVAKVDTENLPVLAQFYQISSLPTLVLFANGREIDRISGMRPASMIQEWLVGSAALSRE